MSWVAASASVPGTSHLKRQQECQDNHCVIYESGTSSSPSIGVFVADGAGTAGRGGLGATASVEAARRFWEHRLAGKCESADLTALMEKCFESVRRRLEEVSVLEEISLRELACTFLAVIATPSGTVACQLGDGAIVSDFGKGYELLFKPMNGEYANTTFFVSDDSANVDRQIRFIAAQARRMAVLTDGLQHLALADRHSSVNPKFFDKRFQTLEATMPERSAELSPALEAYLRSDVICRYTDDDKTLVLVSWTGE
jgi:hypothetical protein